MEVNEVPRSWEEPLVEGRLAKEFAMIEYWWYNQRIKRAETRNCIL